MASKNNATIDIKKIFRYKKQNKTNTKFDFNISHYAPSN